jgi:hypothetical protein
VAAVQSARQLADIAEESERFVQDRQSLIIREHRDGFYPSDHFPVTARLRLQP